MCTGDRTTVDNVEASDLLGAPCPVCGIGSGVNLAHMRFLDPHGVERVDREIWECSAGRHVYRLVSGQLRLVARDGARVHPPVKFIIQSGSLAEL